MDRDATRVLVVSGRGRVHLCQLAATTGELQGEAAIETGGDCPSFAALHPSGRIAYVVNEGSDSVAVIDLDAKALLSVVPSQGAGPAHVSVLPDTEIVAVANYGGGTVALFSLNAAGTELTRRQVLELGPNPHAALSDASGRYLIVPALGADTVFVTPLEHGEAGTPRRSDIARGSGPRHLAFDPLRSRALLVCEHTSELSVLDWNASDGQLRETSRLSLLPAATVVPGNTGADVHVHPSGRFAYASNRGHDSLAIIALDGEAPRLIGNEPTRGRVPRNFALSPSGDIALVANLESNTVSSYRVDAESGSLQPLALNEGFERPFWVGFVK
jgi:6-phosphogluconolactonase